MLHMFNRKQVFMGPSAEDAARAWSILRANKIPYAVTTKGTGTSFRRQMNLKITAGVVNGTTKFSQAVGTPNYLYVVYVHRRDYARAMDLIG